MAEDRQQMAPGGSTTTVAARHRSEPAAGPPPEGVTVIRSGDGTILARKAVVELDRPSLARELAVLHRLHDLAVVQPALRPAPASGDAAAPAWIDLAYVGARTLASSGRDLTEPQLLRVLASAAATLAAAHDRGISHGRVDGSHVLLGPDDTAVLCGWRLAGTAPMPPPPPAAPGSAPAGGGPLPQPSGTRTPAADADVDTHSGTGTDGSPPFAPAADVAALGSLAAELARSNPAVSARMRTQLGAVATAANHPDATVRPPMTELARVLAAAAGPKPATRADRSARRGGRRVRNAWAARRAGPGSGPFARSPTSAPAPAPAGIDEHRPSNPVAAATADPPSMGDAGPARPGSRARPLAAAAVAATLAAGLTVALWSSRFASQGPAPTGADDAADAGAADIRATTSAAHATTGLDTGGGGPADPQRCPTSAVELAAGGLPQHCAAMVTIEGQRLRVGALSFVLGAEGDRAGLSDLSCDGLLEATVLQVSSGRVYVYDRWADDAQPQTARLLGEAPGATNLGDPTGSACGGVRVTLGDDSDMTLSGGAG